MPRWSSLRERYLISARINSKVATEVTNADIFETCSNIAGSPTVTEETRTKPWYILLPNSKVRITWDSLMFLILLFLLFYIPYRTCFYWKTFHTSIAVTWIEQSTDIVFTIDIFLNFFTGFENDLASIAKRYLKGYFIFDLVASVPFQWIILQSPLSVVNNVSKMGKFPRLVKTFKAVKLLKLVRAYKLSLFVEKIESEHKIHNGLPKLVTNLIIVLFIAHLTGCFWYLVGISADDDTRGWIYRYGYHSKSISTQYVASLYWAISTLTTVGYGDICGRTPQEQLYSMIIMLVGATCFAFMVGNLTNIISSLDENDKTKDQLTIVNEFVKSAKLPSALAQQIRLYFDYKLSRHQKDVLGSKYYDAQKLLLQLSSGLRSEILLFLEKDVIERIDLFKNKTPQFVADAVSMLEPVFAHDGEYIIKKDSKADEMYFLCKGQVVLRVLDYTVLEISQGSCFGEVECILGGNRVASVKAVMDCELRMLSKSDLSHLILDYPDVGDELTLLSRQRWALINQFDCRSRTIPTPIYTGFHELR